MKKSSIKLREEQHRELERLTKKGVASANQIMHAQILLHADRGPRVQAGRLPRSSQRSQ